MELWLVRHGMACEIGENGIVRDADRPLSPKGTRHTQTVAKTLRRLKIRPTRILSSPLPRALETARIIASEGAFDTPVEVFTGLCPGAVLEALLARIELHPDNQSVMAVGHMPDLAIMIARLISPAGDARIQFGKSAVCGIAFDEPPAPGRGRLQLLMQSSALRAM